MIELKVESPVPGPEHLKSWFALYVPSEMDAEEQWEELRWHLEFRRRCMNQGFDNLLELLERTKKNILADVAAKKAAKETPK